jgi:DNA-binding GntR family transcriptional regulator
MDNAYAHIREMVMAMTLKPGEWIDDLRLGEQLGLSRTPVREALFLLASEGLVIVKPGGGFMVRTLDLVDISRLFEAQIVLAKSVSRLVVARASNEDLAELAAAEREVQREMERSDPVGVARTNADLHRIEARIAENEYLERLARQIHDQGQRLGFISFGGPDDTRDVEAHFARVREDHALLIDAYRARDAEQADDISTRHVVLFRERILKYVATSGADGIDLAGGWITAS